MDGLVGAAIWKMPWVEGGDVSQMCTLAAKQANRLLCCITRHIIRRSREVIVHYSALARSHLRSTSRFGFPAMRSESDFSRGHHCLPCEYSLRDLGLLSLEKRWLLGVSTAAPQCLRGWSQAMHSTVVVGGWVTTGIN